MASLAQTTRGVLERSFAALPLLIFGWSLFVGATTGNIGLLVLAAGHATVTPLSTWILHTLASFTGEWGKKAFTIPAAASCNILPGGETNPGEVVFSFPSYWLAHIAFFFGFLITNAGAVLDMPAASNAEAEKVERRKSQAQLVRILAWIAFIVFVIVRVIVMGCETIPGLLFGSAIFWWIGVGWYQVARECSARDSDIFGIVQGILPESASDPPPMTCVYTGK